MDQSLSQFSQDATTRTSSVDDTAPTAATANAAVEQPVDNQPASCIHPGNFPAQLSTLNSQPSADRLNLDQELVASQREQVVLAYRQLIGSGSQPSTLNSQPISSRAAAKKLNVPHATIRRWHQSYTEKGRAGLINQNQNSGRRPAYLPTEEELQCVRSIYITLNESEVRGKGLGSSRVTAYRLAAKSHDPRISEDFRHVVLQQRKQKAVPPSWERLLDAPASVLAHVRDNESTLMTYISTPRGMDYIDERGHAQPLMPGTIFESDDGTVNFPVVIPWPYGGDKCSDKFGVKVGRFQLLPIVDRRTRFCPYFHFVIRSKSSYRGEDIVALFGAAFLEIGIPTALCLERGSWESAVVNAALQLANVKRIQAWSPKQKEAVESFFNRLWTPLSLLPGDVGRSRGDNRENTKLLLACEDGRQDPREHFMFVDKAIGGISNGISFVNSEPVQSKHFGTWIPQQLWENHFHSHSHSPLRKLDPSLKVFFAREQRTWTVRAGCVGGKVETPTLRFPVYFQTTELWEFEGCKIKCFFDPFTDPCLGTLTLEGDWRSYKSGHIIARDVPALDLPPQAVLAADWTGGEEYQRSLQIRKAMSKAVRTEAWSWLGTRTSEARDGLGNTIRRESSSSSFGGRDDRAASSSNLSPASDASRSNAQTSVITPGAGDRLSHSHFHSHSPSARRGPFAPRDKQDPAVQNRLKTLRAKQAALAREQLSETEH